MFGDSPPRVVSLPDGSAAVIQSDRFDNSAETDMIPVFLPSDGAESTGSLALPSLSRNEVRSLVVAHVLSEDGDLFVRDEVRDKVAELLGLDSSARADFSARLRAGDPEVTISKEVFDYFATDIRYQYESGSRSGGNGGPEVGPDPTTAEAFAAAAEAAADARSRWEKTKTLVPLQRGWILVTARYEIACAPERSCGLSSRRSGMIDIAMVIRTDATPAEERCLVVTVGRMVDELTVVGDRIVAVTGDHGCGGAVSTGRVMMWSVDEVLRWAEADVDRGAARTRVTMFPKTAAKYRLSHPKSWDATMSISLHNQRVLLAPAPETLDDVHARTLIYPEAKNNEGEKLCFAFSTSDPDAPPRTFPASKNGGFDAVMGSSFHNKVKPLFVLDNGTCAASSAVGGAGIVLIDCAAVDGMIEWRKRTVLEHISSTEILGTAEVCGSRAAIVSGDLGGPVILAMRSDGLCVPMRVGAEDGAEGGSEGGAGGGGDGAPKCVWQSSDGVVWGLVSHARQGLTRATLDVTSSGTYEDVAIPESVALDMSFSPYRPASNDAAAIEAAFEAEPAGSSFRFPASRAPLVFRRREGTNPMRFGLIACFGDAPEALKIPGCRQLECTGDLADYVGCPVWFEDIDRDDDGDNNGDNNGDNAGGTAAGPTIITDATVGDVSNHRRSSNKISSLTQRSSSSSDVTISIVSRSDQQASRTFCFNGKRWLGVIDLRPGVTAEMLCTMDSPTGPVRYAPVDFSEFNTYTPPADDAAEMETTGRKFFRTVSEDMIAIDPAYSRLREGVMFTGAAVGKWFHRVEGLDEGESRQLVIVHESVAEDPSYGQACMVPWSLIEGRREEYAATHEGRPKRAQDVKSLITLRESGEPYDADYWVEPIGELPDGWLSHIHGVGVDTATAGFFDASNYRDTSSLPPVPDGFVFAAEQSSSFFTPDRWHALAFAAVEGGISEDGCSMPHGCCTQSGWGDGCYSMHLQKHRDTGKIVAARLVFIFDE